MCIRDRAEVKEEVKEEIGQLEYISTEEYIEQIEEAESKGEIESIKTVSYTHLDVYKRQVYIQRNGV